MSDLKSDLSDKDLKKNLRIFFLDLKCFRNLDEYNNLYVCKTVLFCSLDYILNITYLGLINLFLKTCKIAYMQAIKDFSLPFIYWQLSLYCQYPIFQYVVNAK